MQSRTVHYTITIQSLTPQSSCSHAQYTIQSRYILTLQSSCSHALATGPDAFSEDLLLAELSAVGGSVSAVGGSVGESDKITAESGSGSGSGSAVGGDLNAVDTGFETKTEHDNSNSNNNNGSDLRAYGSAVVSLPSGRLGVVVPSLLSADYGALANEARVLSY